MRLTYYSVALLGLICLLSMAQAASLQQESYSSIGLPSSGGTFTAHIGPTTIAPKVIISPGDSFSIYCTGSNSVSTPTAIEFRLVPFTSAFQQSPTAIRTITLTPTQVTACSPTVGTQTVFITDGFCTDTGASGGANRHGTLRIYARYQRTIVPTYDVNTDTVANSLVGHVHCSSTITSNALNSPQNPYVGGDTLSFSPTAPTPPFTTDMKVRGNAICGSTHLIEDDELNDIFSSTIKGGLSSWTNNCDLQISYQEIDISTGTWVTERSSQVELNGTLTFDPTETVNRLLSPISPCPVTHLDITGHPVTDVANRGQTIETHCAFQNARAEHVTNNKLARAWITAATSHTRDTTAATASDVLFTSQGQVASTHTLLSTAPVDYYAITVETFGASRSDTELHNYGLGLKTFNISATYRFTDWLYAKNDPASPTNVSKLQIGVDTGYLTPKALQNAAGYPVSGVAVTCSRYTPTQQLENTLSHGTTDSSGNASQVQWNPVAPRGIWSIICNGSLDGNSIISGISVEYTSAFTADTAVQLSYYFTNTTVNVTTTFRQYNPVTHEITLLIPDDDVNIWLEIEDYDGVLLYMPAFYAEMNRSCETCSSFYVEIPRNLLPPEPRRAQVFSQGNISGSAYLGHTQLISPTVSGEPMLPTELSVSLAIFGILGTGAYLSLSNNNLIGSMLAVIGGLIAVISAVNFEAQMLSEVFYTIMIASLGVMALFGWRIYLQMVGTSGGESNG